MIKELSALADNKTWSIMPLPVGKHPVGCRWIFKTKFNSNGTIERPKTRPASSSKVLVEIWNRLQGNLFSSCENDYCPCLVICGS